MTQCDRCKSILIVEDDADIREALGQALQVEGYNVHAAENGRDGLDRLAVIERPCLILLDVMMPVMNGIEFLHRLREDDVLATIPIVMVTAYSHLAEEARGAAAYIKKPVDLDLLIRTVDQYCR